MKYYTICVFLIILFPFLVMAEIIHVPQDQPSIQAGIDAAVNGDTVLVADSTYYENINFKGKAITVASYFILDSDTTHKDSTIINGSQPADPDKGSVVSFISGEDTTSVIYGFTITGGTGQLYDNLIRVGGGIAILNSGARISHNKITGNTLTHNEVSVGAGVGAFPKTVINEVIVEDNFIAFNTLNSTQGTSGGGIFLIKGRITHNKIKQNLSMGNPYGFGGGIALTCDTTFARTSVIIRNNTITDNTATSDYTNGMGIGGGIDVQFCNVLIAQNQLTNNKVRGEIPEGGAGIRLYNNGPSEIKHNTLKNNSSATTAGELWGHGGGICVWYSVGLEIEDNIFVENESAGGGGIKTTYTKGTVISDNTFLNNRCYIGGGIYELQTVGSIISDNRFTRNTADYYGGGIMVENCSPQIYNNLIVRNKATFNGGGIYLGEETGEAEIINNTIAEDTAGIYGGGICANNVSPVIINTILWNNSAPSGAQIYTTGENTHVAYCDIQDTVWMGEGNINIDPMFEEGTYELSKSSYCIGSGIETIKINGSTYNCPAIDYLDNPRPNPQGSNPDIGAIESDFANDIEKSDSNLPKEFVLSQNYPNPFNPVTVISWQLAVSSYVDLSIYNILGQKLAALISEKQQAGNYKMEWNASDLASGVYFYRLETKKFTQTKKMLLVR